VVACRQTFSDELGRVVESLKRKELSVVGQQLTIDVESVEDEINRFAHIGKAVDAECDSFNVKIEEQIKMYADLDTSLPVDVQQSVNELNSGRSRIKVNDLISYEEASFVYFSFERIACRKSF
jgi:hypothetical protein